VAFIKATKRRHWASTRSDSINVTRQRQLFWLFHHEKGLELTCWPRGMTYQTDEKHLTNLREYFVGVVIGMFCSKHSFTITCL